MGSPCVAGLDARGHQAQRLLQTQHRLHPKLLPPVGAGCGEVLLARPRGQEACQPPHSPGGSQLVVAPGACQEVHPSAFQMRKLRPEAAGRGWGPHLGLLLSPEAEALLSGGPQAGLVCVCVGGCVPGLGQGRPLSEPRCAGPSWVAGRGSVCPHPQPTSRGVIFPGAGPSQRTSRGPSPTCRGGQPPSTTRSPEQASARLFPVSLPFSITRYFEGHLQELRPLCLRASL